MGGKGGRPKTKTESELRQWKKQYNKTYHKQHADIMIDRAKCWYYDRKNKNDEIVDSEIHKDYSINYEIPVIPDLLAS